MDICRRSGMREINRYRKFSRSFLTIFRLWHKVRKIQETGQKCYPGRAEASSACQAHQEDV